MQSLVLMLGWTGVFAPVALGAVGSILGCTRAGQAAVGAMLDVDSGHGKFVGVSAMPSSQTVYGIVMMLSLNRQVSVANAPGLAGLGLLAGLALMYSALGQGSCCASAIQVAKDKPEVFGISIAPAAVVEGFAVFTLVFGLILAGNLPN